MAPVDVSRELIVRWGDRLLAVDNIASSKKITIGAHASNHVQLVSREFGARFVIAETVAKEMILRIPTGVGITVVGDQRERLSRDALSDAKRLKPASNDDDVETMVLQLNERVELAVGPVTVAIRSVQFPHEKLNWRSPVDRRFVSSMVFWLALYGLFIFMTLQRSAPSPSLGDDRLSRQAKYVRMVIKPPRVQPEKSKIAARSGGKAASGREGKAGAENAVPEPSIRASPSQGNPNGIDRQKVKNLLSGLVGRGAFGTAGPGANLGSGIDRAVSGLGTSGGGTSVGGGLGFGGLGTRGSGPGGGGTGGTGLGSGGSGSSDLGVQSKDSVRVIPGTTTIVGGLDREEILKVIRRHQNEIKFCYEQELQKQPGLGGKVSVTWTIDAAGLVTEAHVSESSLSNAEVEACMCARIVRWKFPEPEGGTIVTVTFPWILKMAGSD